MVMAAVKKKRQLDLGRVFRAIDTKNRNFDQQLNDAERKEFSAYTSMRWAAGVEGNFDEQIFYLRSTNENANINFFDLSRHPRLQWLSVTTISPDIGTFRHYWVSVKKSDNRKRLFLESQYPDLNEDELDILCSTITDQQIREYAVNLGLDDKDIDKKL